MTYQLTSARARGANAGSCQGVAHQVLRRATEYAETVGGHDAEKSYSRTGPGIGTGSREKVAPKKEGKPLV